jgi:hypothetical protein
MKCMEALARLGLEPYCTLMTMPLPGNFTFSKLNCRRVISMTPGDYSTAESTTILNVTECKFTNGNIASCLGLFDYSYVQSGFHNIRLLKSETYEFVRFKASGGVESATIEARKSDKWIVTASTRCRERSDLPTSESEIIRLASYLDDIVKLTIVDRRHFQW